MNINDLSGVLAQVKARIQNGAPAYRAISDLMVSSAQHNFETEGRPEKWASLTDATRKLKEKHGWTKILFRSGQLRASINGEGGTTGNSATIGSALAYAKLQNDGGTINMPESQRTLRFRQTAGGSLMSQSDIGNKFRNSGKMVVLAKASHKRALEMVFTAKAHQITIPGRPFLLIQPQDVDQYNGILYRYWMDGELTK